MIAGYVFRMDIAYFSSVLLMFSFQIVQLVSGMAECSDDKITLDDDAPEAFRLVLGSHEFSVENEGAIVCNIERFQKAVKHIAEFGTLEGMYDYLHLTVGSQLADSCFLDRTYFRHRSTWTHFWLSSLFGALPHELHGDLLHL